MVGDLTTLPHPSYVTTGNTRECKSNCTQTTRHHQIGSTCLRARMRTPERFTVYRIVMIIGLQIQLQAKQDKEGQYLKYVPASTKWSSVGKRFLTRVETIDNIIMYDIFTQRMIVRRIKRQRSSCQNHEKGALGLRLLSCIK